MQIPRLEWTNMLLILEKWSSLFLTHVILSTVWFHWKILALELWKMQLWSLSKQKTMSTLLMTITKSWIQILNCYALDGRKQWPDTMSESSESAAEFFSQFPMAFLWVRDTGRVMLGRLWKVNLCHRVLIFYTKLAQTCWSLQRSLQNMKHNSSNCTFSSDLMNLVFHQEFSLGK